jgi:hypothetical protein
VSSKFQKLLRRIPDLLVYPFRETGWMHVLFATILHFAASFLFELSTGSSMRGVRRGGTGGLGFLLVGYLLAYLFRVVNVSASGERTLPEWPGPGNWRSTCLTPAVQTAFLGVVIFAPGFLAAVLLPGTPLAHVFFFAGLLVWPIGFLGLALDGSLAGLAPGRGLAAIRQAPTHYAFVAALTVASVWGANLFAADIMTAGPVAGAIGSLVFVYLMLVDGRAIGEFYHANARQLDWFGEADDEPDFYGIGASLRSTDRGAEVVDVLEGSGAERAGLRSGDLIYAVEGTAIGDLSLEEVTERIQGPSGTSVHLAGESADGGRLDVEVVREAVSRA